MKPHEQQLRDEMKTGHPFTLITSSGDRVKVHSYDHCNHLQTGEQIRKELLAEFADESPAGFRWWSESFRHFRPPASQAKRPRRLVKRNLSKEVIESDKMQASGLDQDVIPD